MKLAKQERSSAFEIMRLLAMYMIVFEHCLLATSLHSAEPLSLADNVAWLLEAFSICAVNLFFLLTGYFLNVGSFRFQKWLGIWGKTVFYSIGIYLIAVLLGAESFGVRTLINYCCPVLMKTYWFMQVFIVLSFLLPYLAIMLNHISEKQHALLCLVLLLCFCLHQTFIPVGQTLDNSQGYGIIWAVVLCTVGSFLKRYGSKYIQKVPSMLCLVGYIVFAVGIFITNVLIVKFDIAQGITSRGNFYTYNSTSVFMESLLLFCFFIRLSERNFHSRIINWLSGSALAVYLIGSHPLLLTGTWTKIVLMPDISTNLGSYLLVAVSGSIIVVLFCILIDKIVNAIMKFLGRRYI